MVSVWRTPRDLPAQRVVSATITADPAPARSVTAGDHFGNVATWLFHTEPHAEFTVTLEAEVEVGFASPPNPAATPPWTVVRDLAASGGPEAWAAVEFAVSSPMAPREGQAGRYALESLPPARPILLRLLMLTARIRRTFTVRPGTTTLATSIAQVISRR